MNEGLTVIEKASTHTIDLSQVIGIYPLCNTGAVLVYAIDYIEDKVLAGINDAEPEWCNMTEEYYELTEEQEPGFYLGSLFIPFFEVQRFYK